MKQTAVEWLTIEAMKFLNQAMDGTLNEDTIEEDVSTIITKAKEMEKQQIIEAHGNKERFKCDPDSIVTYSYTFTGEMYYNKTFKNTENESR
jgi:c-di-AMP phosphodiesterase-like protein